MNPSYGNDHEAGLLRGLLGAVHVRESRQRNLAVIRIYGDISGKRPQDRAMVAACYYGTESQWAAVDKDWASALQRADVRCFHATDFFAGRKEFKGWELNGKKHISTAKEFTRIAGTHQLYGFAFGMDAAAFERVCRPEISRLPMKQRPDTPRVWCIVQVLCMVAEGVRLPAGESIAVVFEQEPGIGAAIDFFAFSQKKHEAWTKPFHSFSVVEKSFRPVQVADLFAHETWRNVTATIDGSKRGVRKPLKRMLKSGRLIARFLSEAECKSGAPKMRKIVEEYANMRVGTKRKA